MQTMLFQKKIYLIIGFKMENFIIINNFLSQEQCHDMAEKLDNLHNAGLSLPPDNQCISSPAFYGIFNDESINFLPQIEKIVNKQLYPTYTYARIYQKNEILLPHTDREECEFSFTLTLKIDKSVWPFYIESNNTVTEAILSVGDILVYKGMDQLHWRMPLHDNFQYQAFFHYVDQNGLYAHKKYDSRFSFASSQESIDELTRKKYVLQ